MNHTTLHQKVLEWLADLSVPEQVARQTLEAHQRWSVSCDGCHSNSPDGWKEVKVDVWTEIIHNRKVVLI